MTKKDFQEYLPGTLKLDIFLEKYLDDQATRTIVIFFTLKRLRSTNVDTALFWCNKITEKKYYSSQYGQEYIFNLCDKVEYEKEVQIYLEEVLKEYK